MSSFKNWMMTSRTFAVLIGITISVAVILIISLGIVVGRNTYMNMRLSTICPDYFSEEYAFVVDENGKGIDSVAVELRDNSSFNLIYRTFTDSNGRFILFHDFGSFALHSIPFSYFLNVSVDGWTDTIRYTFERYRTCHFRKNDGPDTIVCSSSRRGKMALPLEAWTRNSRNEGLSWVPFTDVALAAARPSGLVDSVGAENCRYTSIAVGAGKVLCAVIPVTEFQIPFGSLHHLTEGVWYVLDHNGDRRLTDETPRMITAESGSAAECFLGNCTFTDTVCAGGVPVVLECRICGAREKNPVLQYRRYDALYGAIVLDSITYNVSLWDAGATLFSDRSKVVMLVDGNNDGVFDARNGSPEVYGQLFGNIVLGKTRFSIDTIDNDGLHLYCSNVVRDSVSVKRTSAADGTWVDEYKGTVSMPFSLYQTCSAHSYVILYFFEGNSSRMTQQPVITAFNDLVKEQLGDVAFIGINRHATGEGVSPFSIIAENHGWKGALVEQFHATLPEEMVCLDNSATIVCRGAPGASVITPLWNHAGKDAAEAGILFEQMVAKPVVVRE